MIDSTLLPRPDLLAHLPTHLRTNMCGELRPEHVGRTVSVCGWVASRRVHSEHLAFVDLRDYTGIVQCVVDGAADLRSEYVVRVTGTVVAREEQWLNPSLATGEVELQDCTVEVLSAAEPPPFQLDDRRETDEGIRLRHRYLDLRRDQMQRNLRTRATVNSAIRRAMEGQGFLEVETPMLIASTPEGARDFVSPAASSPVRCAAAVAAIVQAALHGRRHRSLLPDRPLPSRRGISADRQFEFMQLDAEMSFASQTTLNAISTTVAAVVEAVTARRSATSRG